MSFAIDPHSLGYLLHHTTSVHRRVMAQHTKAFDITPEQYGVLLQLRTAEGISQKRLSEKMHKDQATVGKMIDKLEAKALVQREADPADRRAFLVHLTDTGSQVVDGLMQDSTQVHEQAVAGIAPEEFDIFIKVMQQLYNNLSQDALHD
ncbi:DNA-binding MarR family transcriptional regulator [Paenibacillus phyllosphaerae]|uniref:DNA-binding MarR family transcriptional regulator n=1 Tax=Paenibacillus phyllosphaerae TaxID=274593 RepID=A0A7W5AW78_9BACL|nr:MarR family transcriptional regulator [Paenibacillus phyllosphaerae]MBB3109727.1 DNA-binding MarR family transcriptional regulator [Paenibacillus phyllosphaerae]